MSYAILKNSHHSEPVKKKYPQYRFRAFSGIIEGRSAHYRVYDWTGLDFKKIKRFEDEHEALEMMHRILSHYASYDENPSIFMTRYIDAVLTISSQHMEVMVKPVISEIVGSLPGTEFLDGVILNAVIRDHHKQ